MALSAAIVTFSNWLIGKVGDKIFDQIIDIKENKLLIDQRFSLAFKKTSNEVQKRYPDALGGDIESYFLSEEISNELFKLLFRSSKIDLKYISSKIDENTLPSEFIIEFITLLKENCLADYVLDKVLSDNQIFITLIGMGENLETIKNISVLTFEEISEIKKLVEIQFNDRFSIPVFLETYSKAALRGLSEINFIGLGIKSHFKKNRKKLFDVYVHPNFYYDTRDKIIQDNSVNTHTELISDDDDFEEERRANYDISKVFDTELNIVILGQPGSGKSVFVKYVMCQILNRNDSVIKNEKILNRIPFRIELRKYFQHKKQFNEGLVKYLAKSFETDFGLLNLTEENVNKLLHDGNIIIFFDGLDEIFNSHSKIEIKNDIENLIESYSNIVGCVTSRFVGYDEAKLSDERFNEFKILNFDNSQIEEYVNKWYNQEEVDSLTRNREVADFLEIKRSIDRELVTNPLLLSLIVILFRNNLKLPESKLEIYQSCTKTLVDKWDQTKELKIELNDEIAKKKETLFADLAFWQYEMLSGQNKIVTNELATSQIANSIINKLKLTDDWITAGSLADEFMNYALKRSLYFDNNFTHKTFLEYYTAYWIFSNIEKKHKKEERDEIISKYITNPFWYIVLELLINMIDQDQADNEIVDELFIEQRNTNLESLTLLLTIIYSIKNISVSTITSLLESTINSLSLLKKSKHQNVLQENLFNSLLKFLSNSNLSQIFITTYRTYSLTNNLDNSSYRRYIILYLELCMNQETKGLSFDYDNIIDKDRFKKLIQKDAHAYLSSRSFLGSGEWDMFSEVLYFLEHFGESSLYKQYNGVFDSFLFISQISSYLSWQIQEENFKTYDKNLDILFHKGLSKINLIENFKNRETGYYFEKPSINLLAEFINTTNDLYKKCLSILLFWKLNNSNYRRYDVTSIKEEDWFYILQINKIEEVYNLLSEKYNLRVFLSPQLPHTGASISRRAFEHSYLCLALQPVNKT